MSRSRRASQVASDGLAALAMLTKSVVDGMPIASGIIGGLVWIIDVAGQFKTNRDAWKDFSEYTAALREDIQSLIDRPSMSLSADLSADLLTLRAPLLRIVSEMQQMKKRSLVSRLLQAQEDPKKIMIFRQMLADASMKFNTSQLIEIRLKLESMAFKREERLTDQSRSKSLMPKLKSCPPPSHLFTGRQDILDAVSSYFTASSEIQKQRIYVLCGLGGSGKSQLAFKFVQSSQEEVKRFSEVFMIDATTSETIEADFKNLAQAKGLGDSFQISLQWLASEDSNWLILFDNADDVELNLREYFPSCTHGNILITTRNQAVRLHGSGTGSHFNVAEMGSTDAESLLVRILETTQPVDDKMRPLVATLAEELGWFALALVQVGSYIVTSECGINQYLDIFRARKGRLLEEGSIDAQKLDNYQRSAYTTWRLSFEKLSSQASHFLQLCSFFHHDGITERMFRTAINSAAASTWVSKSTSDAIVAIFGVDRSEWDALKFLNIMGEIRSFSLINFNATTDVYSIHPLVQTWIRIHVEAAAVTREAALSVLALCIDMPTDYWEHCESFDILFQNSLAVHADAALQQEPSGCVAIAERLSSMYYDAELHAKAILLCTEALQLQELQIGRKHPDRLANQVRLARAFTVSGSRAEGQTICEEVYLTAREVLGTQHRFVFKCGVALGWAYLFLGMLEKAEEMYSLNLKECQEAYGPCDWNSVDAMTGLGEVLLLRGKLSEAESMLLQVIDIRKRLKGPQDVEELHVFSLLSRTYSKQGRLLDAEKIILELIATWSTILGPHHRSVSSCKNNLAMVYASQRRLSEAEKLYIEVVDSTSQLFGPKHSETLIAKGNLAYTYLRHEKLEEAKQLLSEILLDATWEPDYFGRLRLVTHLARVYHLQKRTEEATNLMEDSLQRLTMQLGPEHRFTMEAQDDLSRWKEETNNCHCKY